MVRTFTHAVTGRSIRTREGTEVERLVEADDNWIESNPSKPTESKEASDGSGDTGGRAGGSRKGSQRKRD